MTTAIKQWTRNFFIYSSFEKGLIQNLSCEARQAYFSRDYTKLRTLGEKLKALSPKAEYLGRYYVALSISRQSVSGNLQVKREFELLADSSIDSIRAAAMIASAGADIFLGNVGQQTRGMLLEAAALSLKLKDRIGFVQAQSQLSLLCSLQERHEESLLILRGLQPIVRSLDNDVLVKDFYNSVAYELMQVEKLKESQFYINFCLTSPHLPAYPEWLETAREIHQHVKVRSLLYAMGEVEGQIVYKKKRSNVLQFKLRQQQEPFSLPLCFKMPDGSDFHICDYPIEEMPILENCVKIATARKAQRNTDNATK